MPRTPDGVIRFGQCNRSFLGELQAIQMEDRNQTLCVQAGYIGEGARAFVEKREPNLAG